MESILSSLSTLSSRPRPRSQRKRSLTGTKGERMELSFWLRATWGREVEEGAGFLERVRAKSYPEVDRRLAGALSSHARARAPARKDKPCSVLTLRSSTLIRRRWSLSYSPTTLLRTCRGEESIWRISCSVP